MNKTKATVSQPPVLHQKRLIQSILQFAPLKEASLSAKVCKSWRNATQNGFNFHPKRLTFSIIKYGTDEWGIHSDEEGFPRHVRENVREISEPRRSHLLEICDRMHFWGYIWPHRAIASLTQGPPNLKRLKFDGRAPTKQELNVLLEKIDFTNIEEVKFIDVELSSIPVEQILNSLPSLKKADFYDVGDNAIDFKQVKPIETVHFSVEDDMPNLEGKVKVLQLEKREFDDYSEDFFAFDLELIQGVEKIILKIMAFKYRSATEEKFDFPAEEICRKLSLAKEVSLKAFVIDVEDENLLTRILGELENHDADGWSHSVAHGQIAFKRIEK